MTITLTDIEMATINILANTRTLVARGSGVVDKKIGKQSGVDIDIDGLMGEYAFCKWHNIFPDLISSPRSGSYDCLLKGKRFDIKTTRYKSGRLLCTTKDNPDVDIYALAIIDPSNSSVSFVGYSTKDNLRKEENLKDLGHGKGYCLEQSQLKKFKV